MKRHRVEMLKPSTEPDFDGKLIDVCRPDFGPAAALEVAAWKVLGACVDKHGHGECSAFLKT